MRQYLVTCSSIALSQKDLSTSEGIVRLKKRCYSSNRFVAQIFTVRMRESGAESRERCLN